MKDDDRSETSSLPSRPPMPAGPSSSKPLIVLQPPPPPPPKTPTMGTPQAPPTTSTHDVTPIPFHAPMQAVNGAENGVVPYL